MGRTHRISFLLVGLALAGCTMHFDWEDEASYARFTQDEDAGDEQRLDAHVALGVGRLEIEAGDGTKAYEIDLNYNEAAFRPEVGFERDGSTARLRFELEGEGAAFRRPGKTRLNLRLNPETPVELSTETGVGESRLDLTGLKVQSMNLESGVGETELAMMRPNEATCEKLEVSSGVGSLEIIGLGNFGFEEFHFQGGVGATTLDFSGDWHRVGEVRVEVGIGAVEIKLPRDVGAEVRVSKSFLSSVNLSGFEKQGNTYYSKNRDQTDKIIKIRVTAGIGEVDFDWM